MFERIHLIIIKIKSKIIELFLKKKKTIYYLSSSIVLPEKLSKEEELILVERLENGDKSVRQTLVERNLRLVAYIAQKFEKISTNIEDLVSIGTIGLIKAINSFEPSKKIKIATYASRCIQNEILMHLRKNNKIKTEISLDNPVNIDGEGNELLISDIMGSEPDMIYKEFEIEVENSELKNAVEELPVREREIMEMRFGLFDKQEKTQKEVADEMGISQSYISRLEKKILDKLKTRIENVDNDIYV